MKQHEYDIRKPPMDHDLNKQWRAQTYKICDEDSEAGEEARQAVFESCKKDFWYWALAFAYVHETRILDDDIELKDFDTKVPFIPWEHQIPVVDRILKCLGKRDLRVVKSRAQGASWILVLIFLWMWLFHRGFKGNLVSKDENAVDRKNDMDSLMAKMDWLIEQLPVWMVGVKGVHWSRQYKDHTLTRMDGETAITGYACTQDVASGGRCMVFGVDEHAKHPRPQDKEAMASTQPISRCRLFISTPKGQDGEFFKICHDNTIEEPVLFLDWRDNPSQNRGLYRIVKGIPVPVDAKKFGPLTDDYTDLDKWTKLRTRLEERGYDLTNKKERSPWYDQECLRAGASPTLVAQEYDMHFGASEARYFSDALCDRLTTTAHPPTSRGEFFFDPEELVGTWSPNPDGRFKLFTELDFNSQPPLSEYIVACDICAGIGGTGSSNSTISVLNRKTGKKVLAFASPAVKPYNMAELAIALCKWFRSDQSMPAFLIWENQGPGKEFTDRLERTDFQFYYRRKQSKDSRLNDPNTNKPGYFTWKRSALLGPYREALLEGHFDNPDFDAIEELKQYQMGLDGEPYHLASKDKSDPSGAGASHGDRVIADALAWRASIEFGDHYSAIAGNQKANPSNPINAPKNSFAWRREQYLKLMRKNRHANSW